MLYCVSQPVAGEPRRVRPTARIARLPRDLVSPSVPPPPVAPRRRPRARASCALLLTLAGSAVHAHRRLHDHDAARAAVHAAVRHRPAGSSACSSPRTRSRRRRAASSPRSGSTASTASARCSCSTPASSSRPRCAGSRRATRCCSPRASSPARSAACIGALVLAIVADVVPYARRARGDGDRRRGVLAGGGRWACRWGSGSPRTSRGARRSSCWPRSASSSALVGDARLVPPLRAHVARGARRHPVAQLRADLRRAQSPARVRVHDRADDRAVFTVVPFIAAVQRRQRRRRRSRPADHLLRRRARRRSFTAQVIGRLADRYGKKRVFTILAFISIVPILVTTHLPPLPLAAVVAVSVAVLRVRARALRAGDGARHRQRGAAAARQLHELQRVDAAAGARGSRRSSAGLIIGRAADGSLTHYGAVGWLRGRLHAARASCSRADPDRRRRQRPRPRRAVAAACRSPRDSAATPARDARNIADRAAGAPAVRGPA